AYRRRSRRGRASDLPRKARSAQERTLETNRRLIVDDTESHDPMAATEWGLRSRRVGVSLGKVNHTTRARQCLAWAHCATAENHPTRMGHVSDHATHPCQSFSSGRYR